MTDSRPERGWIAALMLFFLIAVSPRPVLEARQAVNAGEVRGKITIAHVADDMPQMPMVDRYSTHRPAITGSEKPDASAMAYRFSEKAVVYLEGVSLNSQPFTPPATHPRLDQKDLMFHPQVLPVVIGSTVDFPNRDLLFHNVFSYSQPKEFDLGRYPTGKSRSVLFDRPGIVRVYCDIHSHMNATILVLENPFFSVPADDGMYVIKNIPNGTYVIKLWYGRELLGSQSITINGREPVVADFTY